MKTFIWQLAYLSNECCLIENENALEGSNRIVRDEGMLKNLHQKKSRWDADAKGNRPLFFKDFDPEMSHDYG
ncbi:hypothetical protein BD310DRAFT_940424 [Dichomitus squalens]|uniref:Uncharacterized protein n=1 Tax=Dichomitus squalens TaxID=114155 RepID=A0A4Q9PGD4_9APHY|nr:hypothetical protein BD310DRAFT_940424 [Dichomitus squalens]